MENQLQIYNTLSRKKEVFKPLHPGKVGLYVCGPTVYGKAHLGHARPAVTYDLLFRYLKHIGYKVRYVRNITDVGHLANDSDEGEDKIAKRARLEELEPMEIVQIYTNDYHKNMQQLNVLPPSIEPRATGHIIEQMMWKNMPKITRMANSRGEKLTICKPIPANWMGKMKSVRRSILQSGRKPHQNTSCAGHPNGAMVFRAGTWNVLP